MLFYAYTEIEGSEHESARDLLFSLIEKHLPELRGASLFSDRNGSLYLSRDGVRERDVFVSLSHSHLMCAAALSDTPVGVDIELVADRKSAGKIEERFMGRLRMPCGIEEKEHPFFYRWTYFEACYKVTQGYDTPMPVRVHETVKSKQGDSYVLCVVKG